MCSWERMELETRWVKKKKEIAEWKEYDLTRNMFLGKAEQQRQFGSVPGKHSRNGAPNLELVQPVGLVYI